jgi:putative methionine-R-sulfoxide reductase with GAF domain
MTNVDAPMSILLVEDDESTGQLYFKMLLTRFGAREPVWNRTYGEARASIRNRLFDVAIVDLGLSDGGGERKLEGIQLVQELSALLSPPIVIVSTGFKGEAEKDPEFPWDSVFCLHEKFTQPLEELIQAIERARRLKRVQTLLASAGKYASGTPVITEELKAMLQQFVDLTGASVCHFLLPTEGKQHLEIVVDTGDDEGRQVEINRSVTGAVFTGKKAIRLGDVQGHPLYQPVCGDKVMKSELAVPLMEDDRPIGVLNIESEAADAFSQAHENLMAAFARFTVVALQSDRRRHGLQNLVGATTNQLLEAVVDLPKIFEAVLDRGKELIGATSGFLTLVEDGKLKTVATTDEGNWPKGSTLEVSNSICGLAVQRRYSLNVKNVRQAPYRPYFQPTFSSTTLSELVVPLRLEDEVIGVLNFESDEPGAFTSEDQRLLVALASQAAVAIRITNEVERELAAARAAERNATVAELAAGLSHNVNSPAEGILFDLARIQTTCTAALQLDPRLVQYLTRIEQDAKSILGVPRQIADRTEVYTPPVPLTCEDLVVKRLTRMREKGEIPDDVSVVLDASIQQPVSFLAYANSTYLTVDNLVHNAIQVMGRKGAVCIGATVDRDRKCIDIWIEDSGPGVPAASREVIFDRDFTTKVGSATSGIGLWWVKTHLARLKAEVWVEDAVCLSGARFVVRFPVCDFC